MRGGRWRRWSLSHTRLRSLNLDKFSLSLLTLLDILLHSELCRIDENLLAGAGLNQNMLATSLLLLSSLGRTSNLDYLLLTVLCLEDELLGWSRTCPATFLYEKMLVARLRGLNH